MALETLQCHKEIQDMAVIVRKAHIKDIGALCALLTDLFSIEKDFIADEARQKQGLELLIESHGGLVLVACSGDQVIGMVSVQRLISTAEGGAVGLVEDLVVHHDFRGKGVGKKLMVQLVDECRQMKMTRLQLLADNTNAPALAFYNAMDWSGTQLVALRHRIS